MNNLRTLYDNLTSEYDLPAFEIFQQDMVDSIKRKELHTNLSPVYDLPDFDTFSNDMGFGVKPTPVEHQEDVIEQSTGKPTEQLEYNPEVLDAQREKERQDSINLIGDTNIVPLQEHEKPLDVTTKEKMLREAAEKQKYYGDIADELESAELEDLSITPQDIGIHKQPNMFEKPMSSVDIALESDTYKKFQSEQAIEIQMREQFSEINSMLNKEVEGVLADPNVIARLKYSDRPEYLHLETSKGKTLSAAAALMKEANTILEESKKDGGNLKAAGRALKNTALDLDTWDYGKGDLNTMQRLSLVLDKVENDKDITEEEETLLDAAAMNAAIKALHSEKMKRGYTWGEIAGQSLPFMLEFMVNPASGIGQGLAKRISLAALKRGSGRLALSAVEKGAKGYALKQAGRIGIKAGARIIGDMVGATAMTFTTGSMNTAANVLNRQIGEATFDIDDNNKIIYTGHEGGTGLMEALYKGIGAQVIEYQSEMFGASGAGNVALKALNHIPVVRRLGKGISASQFGKAFRAFNSSQAVTAFKKLEDRMQWSGTFGEYIEEVYGTILNSIFIGDENFSDLVDLDQQIDTFMGLALSGGAMSSFQGVSYGYDRARVAGNVRSIEKAASEIRGWSLIKGKLLTEDYDSRVSALKDMLASEEYTSEEKKTIMEYTAAITMRDAMALSKGEQGDLEADMMNFFIVGNILESGNVDFKTLHALVNPNMREDIDIKNPAVLAGVAANIKAQEEALTKALNEAGVYIDMATLYKLGLQNKNARSGADVNFRLEGESEMEDNSMINMLNSILSADNLTDELKKDILVFIQSVSATRVIESNLSELETLDKENEKARLEKLINKTTGSYTFAEIDGNDVYITDGIAVKTDESGETVIDIDNSEEAVYYTGHDGVARVAHVSDFKDIREAAVEHYQDVMSDFIAAEYDKIKLTANTLLQMNVEQEVANQEAQIAAQEAEVAELNSPFEVGQMAFANNEIAQGNVIITDINEDGTYNLQVESEHGVSELEGVPLEDMGKWGYEIAPTEEAPVEIPEAPTAETEGLTPTEEDRSLSHNEKILKEYNIDAEKSGLDDFSGLKITKIKVLERRGKNSDGVEVGTVRIIGTRDSDGMPFNNSYEVFFYDSEGANEKILENDIEQSDSKQLTPEQIAEQEREDFYNSLPLIQKGEDAGNIDHSKMTPEQNVRYFDYEFGQQEANKAISQQIKNLTKRLERETKSLENDPFNSNKRRKAAETEAELQAYRDILQKRQLDAQKAHQERRAESLEKQAERAEAQREQEVAEQLEKEKISGVPDFTVDSPDKARTRGFWSVNGERVDRAQPLQIDHSTDGTRKFTSNQEVPVKRTIVSADDVHSSHTNGVVNTKHFIPEAQPKDRTDLASKKAGSDIAQNIKPAEITGGITAYTGSPVINSRGEVIQGNGRVNGLQEMYHGYPESSEKYKQHLIETAHEYGMTPEEVAAIKNPIAVDVFEGSDAEAIKLGQYTAADTESGGIQRLSAQHISTALGQKGMTSLSNVLFDSSDLSPEDTMSTMLDKNGRKALELLAQKKIINDTQFQSAFDKKGNITPEAKQDLLEIISHSLFQDGSSNLKRIFNNLPDKARRAILQTIHRDLDSEEDTKIKSEIQAAIEAYHFLQQDESFANAKTYQEASVAAENARNQTAMFNSESDTPLQKYSTFAVELAKLFKTDTQNQLKLRFERLYDSLQGKGADIFTEAEVLSLSEAIKKHFNSIDYVPNGQIQRTPMAQHPKDSPVGRPEQQGGVEGGEQDTSGQRTPERTGGVEINPQQQSVNELSQQFDTATTVEEKASIAKAIFEIANERYKGAAETVVVEKTEDLLTLLPPAEQMAVMHQIRQGRVITGLSAEDKVYVVAEGCDNANELSQVWVHEQMHIQNRVNNVDLKNLFNSIGKERIGEVVPPAYNKFSESIQADEYIAFHTEGFVDSENLLSFDAQDSNNDVNKVIQTNLNTLRNGRENKSEDILRREQSGQGTHVDSSDTGGVQDIRGESQEGDVKERSTGQDTNAAKEEVKKNVAEKILPKLDEKALEGLEESRSIFGESDDETISFRLKPGSMLTMEAVYAASKLSVGLFENDIVNIKEYTNAMAALVGNNVLPHIESIYNFTRSFTGRDDLSSFEEVREFQEIINNRLTEIAAKKEQDVHNTTRDSQHDGDVSDSGRATKDTVRDEGRREGDGVSERPDGRSGEQGVGRKSSDGGSNLFTTPTGEQSNITDDRGQGVLSPETTDARDTDDRGDGADSARGLYDDGRRSGPSKRDNAEPAKQDFKERTRIAEEKQAEAEDIPVKLQDRDNISQTLPLLLPEQQDDVLKAENRFFGKSHKTQQGANGKGFLFTNGTGTGKTYTGMGVIKRFSKQGKNNILIVAPNDKVIADWIETARKFNLNIDRLTGVDDAGIGISITTYANFGVNKDVQSRDFDLVVFDESHRIMESKNGVFSARTNAFKSISNSTEAAALRRIEQIDPAYNNIQDKAEDIRDAEREFDENFYNLTVGQREEEQQKIDKLKEELKSLRQSYEQNVKPQLIERAKAAHQNTKVLLLSATPFKGHFNLRYANNILFDWGSEDMVNSRGSRVNSEAQFFLGNFGSAYEWKYHQLQTKQNSNAEAIAMQEVEFSEKLKKEGVMSGRVIESEMDYAREFPYVTLEMSETFNKALNDMHTHKEMRVLSKSASDVFQDYQYTTKLLESLKASMVIPRIQEHLDLGRKVVVFHRRRQADVEPPFASILIRALNEADNHEQNSRNAYNPQDDLEKAAALRAAVAKFRQTYPELLKWEKTLGYESAIDQLTKAFPDKTLVINGTTKKSDKVSFPDMFNDDNSGKDILIVQEEAGKEGMSLHDTTGEKQRVLISLSLPQSSTTTLQIEGRIYRIGQMSNAIFEYPLLGLDQEIINFSQNINRRLSTTENLAMGNLSRDLLRAFSDGVLFAAKHEAPHAEQGVGGKEYDRRLQEEMSEFRRAVLVYHTNQKETAKRSQREGTDFYATPEPIGQKMVEWLNLQPRETVLEPSAGNGAIAMWFPQSANATLIEPSNSLFSKLSVRAGGGNKKAIRSTFEDFNIINKFDGIVMNPPFGVGGKTAISHVEKAFKHLRDGGRMIAIIPRGAMDSRMDKFFEENESAGYVGQILLPSITFQQAGTSVGSRIVIIDKGEAGMPFTYDMTGVQDIETLFDRLENIEVKQRQGRVVKEEASAMFNQFTQKHSRLKTDMFMAALSQNVSRDVYLKINEVAKKHNGYYSGYKSERDNIKSGFAFKTKEDADAFVSEVETMEVDINFRIGRKRKDDMRKGLINSLTTATPEQIENTITEIEKLGESVTEGGNPKLEKIATHWAMQGTIILPEDNNKIIQAAKVADIAKVDPIQYKSPMELIESNTHVEIKEDRINPDDVKTLSNKQEYGYGVTVYDVDESEESRKNMRQIINTHFGKDRNPWCVLQADMNGELTLDSKGYWDNYNSTPKKVAFQDGRLLAFSASATGQVMWWDSQDRPSSGIPMKGKIPNDPLGRSAIYDLNTETNEIGNLRNITKGNKRNGTYEEWYNMDKIKLTREYQNGIENGKEVHYHENGMIYYEATWVDGRKEGKTTSYYSNGQIYEQNNLKNYRLEGESLLYAEDGVLIKKANYNKEGKYDGEQQFWYDNGNTRRVTYYIDGNKHGKETTYHENGSLAFEGSYEHDNPVGIHTQYYPDGGVFSIVSHEEDGEYTTEFYSSGGTKRIYYADSSGRAHGETLEYHENGQKKSEEHHNHGQRISRRTWSADGLLESESYYRRDSLIHTKEYHNNGQLQYEWKRTPTRDFVTRLWSEDGVLISEESAYNGKREGRYIRRTQEGVDLELATYKNGKRVGSYYLATEGGYETGYINSEGQTLYFSEYKIIDGKEQLVKMHDYRDMTLKEWYDNGYLKYENTGTGEDSQDIYYYEDGSIQATHIGLLNKLSHYYGPEGNLYQIRAENGSDVRLESWIDNKPYQVENYSEQKLHGEQIFYNEKGQPTVRMFNMDEEVDVNFRLKPDQKVKEAEANLKQKSNAYKSASERLAKMRNQAQKEGMRNQLDIFGNKPQGAATLFDGQAEFENTGIAIQAAKKAQEVALHELQEAKRLLDKANSDHFDKVMRQQEMNFDEYESKFENPEDISKFAEESLNISYGSKEKAKEALEKTVRTVEQDSKLRDDNRGSSVLYDTGNHTGDKTPISTTKGVAKRTVLEGFKESGFIEFAGTKIESPQDIADLFAIHRSPYIEKIHLIFVDEKGVILGTHAFTDNAQTHVEIKNIAAVVEMYDAYAASGVYFLHNHPSGNHKVSMQDIAFTDAYERLLAENNQKLLGHVVINSDKFSYINTAEKPYPFDMYYESTLEEYINTQVEEYEYKNAAPKLFTTRESIGSGEEAPKRLLEISKALLTENSYKGAIIYLDGNLKIAAYDVFPEGATEDDIIEIAEKGYDSKLGAYVAFVHDGSYKFNNVPSFTLDVIDTAEGRSQFFMKIQPDKTVSTALWEQQAEYGNKELQSIKDKAVSDGTFMKAPNGKETNLNEKQWLQVRTENFKDWFGDWENDPENASKVVDENGEPLVAYHGTIQNFNTFRLKDSLGYHFGGNIEQALDKIGFYNDLEYKDTKTIAELEKEAEESGYRIIRTYLDIKNPEKIKDTGSFDNVEKKDDVDGYVYENSFEGDEEKENTAYIVKHSTQIKSATDNVGTFDSEEDDIRFRLKPNPDFKLEIKEEVERYNGKAFELEDDNIKTTLYATRYNEPAHMEELYTGIEIDDAISEAEWYDSDYDYEGADVSILASNIEIPIQEFKDWLEDNGYEDYDIQNDLTISEIEEYLTQNDYHPDDTYVYAESEPYNMHSDELIEEVKDELSRLTGVNISKYSNFYIDRKGNMTNEFEDSQGRENQSVSMRIADHTHNPSNAGNDLRIVIADKDNTVSRFRGARTDMRFSSEDYAEDIVQEIQDYWREYAEDVYDHEYEGVNFRFKPEPQEVYNKVETEGLSSISEDWDAAQREIMNGLDSETKNKLIKQVKDKKVPTVNRAIQNYLSSFAEKGVLPKELDRVREALKLTEDVSDDVLKTVLWLNNNPNDGSLQWKAKFKLIQEKVNPENIIKEGEVPLIGALEEYERRIGNLKKAGYHKFTTDLLEAHFDRLVALRILQETISGGIGKVPMELDAWRMDDNSYGKIEYKVNEYMDTVFRPMIEEFTKADKKLDNAIEHSALKNLVEALNNDKLKGKTNHTKILVYTLAKTGLERNDVKRLEEAERFFSKHKRLLDSYLEEGIIDKEMYDAEMHVLQSKIEERASKSTTDYSGLTGLAELLGYEGEAQELAEAIVKETEMLIDTKPLWESIRNSTLFALEYQVSKGMLSQENMDRVIAKYDYYMPLRGWDETTASDIYEYMGGERGVDNVIMTAKGRTSLSEDPRAHIMSMAMRSIMQTEKNFIKQAFYKFIEANPNDVATVHKSWIRNIGDKENPEWVEVFPDIKEGSTPEEIREAIDVFEIQMEGLKKQYKAMDKNDGINLGLKIGKGKTSEHMVKAMVDGKERIVYIHGNPRAAQALNGMNMKDMYNSMFARGWRDVNRYMSGIYTSWNIEFSVSNFLRDFEEASMYMGLTKGNEYKKHFQKNIFKVFSSVHSEYVWGKNSKYHDYIKEFQKHGGETGFTFYKSIERLQKEIEKMADEMSKDADKSIAKTAKDVASGTLKAPFKLIGNFNQSIEALTRFAIFVTSRERGFSPDEAANDAKNSTINFNKKGTGAWGNKELLQMKIFANAGLQGVYRLYLVSRQANSQEKAKIGAKVFGKAARKIFYGSFMMGLIIPFANVLLNTIYKALGWSDDDPLEKYFQDSDWSRRTNYSVNTPKGTVKKPIAHELRWIYGMGETAATAILGMMRPEDVPLTMLQQTQNVLPIEWSNKAIIPSAVAPIIEAYWLNENFMDLPISGERKGIADNTEYPGHTKATKYTWGFMTDMSKALNELSGGSDVEKGAIDIDPAKLQHVTEGYTGGFSSVYLRPLAIATGGIDSDRHPINETPFIRRIYKRSEPTDKDRLTNRLYYDVRKDVKEAQQNTQGYKRKAKDILLDAREHLDSTYKETIKNDRPAAVDIARARAASELFKNNKVIIQPKGEDSISEYINLLETLYDEYPTYKTKENEKLLRDMRKFSTSKKYQKFRLFNIYDKALKDIEDSTPVKDELIKTMKKLDMKNYQDLIQEAYDKYNVDEKWAAIEDHLRQQYKDSPNLEKIVQSAKDKYSRQY